MQSTNLNSSVNRLDCFQNLNELKFDYLKGISESLSRERPSVSFSGTKILEFHGGRKFVFLKILDYIAGTDYLSARQNRILTKSSGCNRPAQIYACRESAVGLHISKNRPVVKL